MDPFVDPFQRRAPHKPWPKKWVSPIFGNPQIPPARTEKRVEYRVKNSFVEVAAVDPGHLSLEDKLGFCHRSGFQRTPFGSNRKFSLAPKGKSSVHCSLALRQISEVVFESVCIAVFKFMVCLLVLWPMAMRTLQRAGRPVWHSMLGRIRGVGQP